MNAALCWKEYREQRGLWLAVAVLAVLLSLALASLARGGIGQAHSDEGIRFVLIAILYSLAIGHGIVCGAMLLANEKETGTLAFLDILTAERAVVWQTKLAAGAVLTLSQALFLMSLAATLHLASWIFCAHFVAAAGLALLCGLVGGAWCASVFPAVLGGIAMVIGSLLVSQLFPSQFFPSPPGTLALLGLATILGFFSRHRYCEADATRQLPKATVSRPGWIPVLWWLALRQGRWAILAGLGLSGLAGWRLHLLHEYLWPAATLAIGLTCGIAVFASEQPAEQERFLGVQRLPPGRVWFGKTFFWALVAGGMVLALTVGSIFSSASQQPSQDPMTLFSLYARPDYLSFDIIWLLYGFSFGQFFSLLSRRIVVATFLALVTCLAVLMLWLPSMIFGGLHFWQILGIPFLLVLANRLSMWTWFCGRFFTKRHLAGLASCGLATMAWLAICFWHRIAEIPAVPAPFDVMAYEESLNAAARCPTASLIREALRDWKRQKKEVADKLGIEGNEWPGREESPHGLMTIAINGWPTKGTKKDARNDAKLARWLDAMFAGAWAEKMSAAVHKPLGLLADPREFDRRSYSRELWDFRTIDLLFSARSLQLQVRGSDGEALEHLDVALALARQVGFHAPGATTFVSLPADDPALLALSQWLSNAGPHADLLRKALEMVRRHEMESPGLLDYLKAEYIVKLYHPEFFPYDGGLGSVERRIATEGWEMPWEKDRYLRFLNAISQGQFARAKAPRKKLTDRQTADVQLRIAFDCGLPLADGPTTSLSPGEWGQLISDSFFQYSISTSFLIRAYDRNLAQIRVRELMIAAALYQVDQGKPPAKLDDLVPRYMPAVPLNPMTDEPFSYKVSTGEKVKGVVPGKGEPRDEELLPGQGVLWIFSDLTQQTMYFPVPLLRKKSP